MKFTYSWLKEHLDIKASVTEISNKLTQIGLEVEAIKYKGEGLAKFKTVEILEVNKHPAADKLNICKIKTADDVIDIVCGAPNVRVGLKTIFAPLNSIIPANNMQVKKVKIRGIESAGMLCSAKELAIGEESEGIIELAATTKIGKPLIDIFALDDYFIEIAITPNRGDCLGVYGIARDLAATKIGKLKKLANTELKPEYKTKYSCSNKKAAENQINLIEIKNVVNRESPEWLKQRLESIGLKTKNAIIDITNYMLFNYGQPMHAYDADKLDGQEIIITKTTEAEKLIALDDKEYMLAKDALVVKDASKIIALAGIIGAKNSAIETASSNILLEAANFSALDIIKTGRNLQIETDSRYRFERGIDALSTKNILQKTAQLIVEICGGTISDVVSTTQDFAEKRVTLSHAALERAACYNIAPRRGKEIFTDLGFDVSRETSTEIELIIPSWRNDISIEEDLIEEVLRIEGYDKIPLEPINLVNKLEENCLDVKKDFSIKKNLACMGLNEVISWSFYSKEDALLYGFSDNLKLINPISEELAIMRESLVPNLVKLAAAEQNKGEINSAIFESGKIFLGKEQNQQKDAIAILRAGPRRGKEANNSSEIYDIFDIKSDIFGLLANLGINSDKLEYNNKELPIYLHHNRSGKIYLGKNYLGYFGELHPKIAQELGIKMRLNIGEIFMDNMPKIKAKKKLYIQNDLQAVSRDFCFIIDENIRAIDLKKELLKTNQEIVKEVRIFDVYVGEKLPIGKKSIALTATLQPKERSLTGAELEEFNLKVIKNFAQKFQAELP